MAEVIWTEPALNALEEIADHIALDDYDAACRLIRKVFEKVNLLEGNPNLGSKSKDLRARLPNESECLSCNRSTGSLQEARPTTRPSYTPLLPRQAINSPSH